MSNNDINFLHYKKNSGKEYRRDIEQNRKWLFGRYRPQKNNTFIYSYSVNLAKIPRYWREKRKHDYYYYYN